MPCSYGGFVSSTLRGCSSTMMWSLGWCLEDTQDGGEEKMPHNRRTAEEISELAYDQAMLTCTCVVAPRLQHGLYLSDALSQVIRGHLMPLPSQILDHQPHQL